MPFHVQNSAILFPNTKVSEAVNISTRTNLNLVTSAFTGNGVVVAFTLNFTPVAVGLAELVVYVDRKKLVLGTDFTVTGSVVTTAVAPANGSFVRVVSVPAGGLISAGIVLADFNGNSKSGQVVLSSGAITVSTTNVTANSRIFVTSQIDGGTPGSLRVSSRVVGTSFTITSSSNTDTSTVFYTIFEPA